jgi:hypothetical protein
MQRNQISTIVLALIACGAGNAAAQLVPPSARSFGFAGAYIARASGYEAPYWNPANLGLPDQPAWSIGIAGASASMSNNSLSYGQITDLYGEYLDDATKSELLAAIRRDDPNRMFEFGAELGANALGIQIWRFAVGVGGAGYGDFEVTPDVAELLLFGNVGEDGTSRDFNIGGSGQGSALSVAYLSYAQPFTIPLLDYLGMKFSIGASVKYGIANALVRVTDQGSQFTSDPLSLDADVEVLMSDDANSGRIWALDLGAAMDWANWRFGLALQNAFTDVSWNEEEFELTLYDGTADLEGATLTDTTLAFSELTPEQQASVLATLEAADAPKRLRLGAMYRTGPTLSLSFDYVELIGGTLREAWERSFSAGAELRLLPMLPLRAGVASDLQQLALAGGIGIYAGPAHLDFSIGTMSLAAGDGVIGALSVSIWPSIGY